MITTLEIRPFTREVSRNFVMIVHRKALLDLIPLKPPFPSGSPFGGRQEHTITMIPWKKWGPPITRWFNADDFSTVFITTTSGQRCVQYTPSHRRPVQAEDDGDRCDTIHILDFNPWHVKIARHLSDSTTVGIFGLVGKEPSKSSQKSPPPNENTKEPEENVCHGYGAFLEDVVGRLPYLVRTNDEKWDYDAILMDEERLLGLRVSFFV